jgi:hypothetical protein
VAISVDPPDVTRDLCQKAGYTFTFLSDPGAQVTGATICWTRERVKEGMTLPVLPSFASTGTAWSAGAISPVTTGFGPDLRS